MACGGGDSKDVPDTGKEKTADDDSQECPICLQVYVHPVELPCGHIFCFLCIKGVAMQGPNGRCAICRASIPTNVLTHPRLKDINQLFRNIGPGYDYEWFYEARGGGWWAYDERSMVDLERAYSSGQNTCQLLIAGHLYEINFQQMIQYRMNNRSMFRRIKRDLATAEKRGIAGIRLGNNPSNNHSDNSSTARSNFMSSARNGSTSRGDSGAMNLNNLPRGNDTHQLDNDSDDDDGDEGVDSDDTNYLDEEEDEMDLEEEEEDLNDEETDSDSEHDDVRDGARAPTRRSDRSTSSSNQTPPPTMPSSSSLVGGNRNVSSSSPSSNGNNGKTKNGGTSSRRRGASSAAGGGYQQSTSRSRGNLDSSSSTSPSPQFLVGSVPSCSSFIRLSPAPASSNPNTSCNSSSCDSQRSSSSSSNVSSSSASRNCITTPAGITCLLLGPGVCITVDQQGNDGEIL